MIKRILLTAVVGVAGSMMAVQKSDAGIFFRPAPLRRVVARTVLPPYPVARTVLPPYPVARHVVARPLYTPYVGPVYGAPVIYSPPVVYGSPYVYGGGVSVVVGF